MGGIGFIVQRWIVEPDELAKETPYLKYSIDYTQKAFGMDSVEVNTFPVEQN